MLRTVFQPVASLATGQVAGFEALTRIDVEPARPVGTLFAEANGCGLGPVLEAAAIRAALEPLGRPPGTHLALNVSYSALPSDEVQSVLPQDLTDIVIEITEHEAIDDDDDALREALQQVRERGALIALDDAGAGYSGLKQLARLKPDIVKLDRSLVNGVNGDPARLALIESFVRYSNRMGAIVCAEGIETLDELAALADLDVQWGQGHVLAAPLERVARRLDRGGDRVPRGARGGAERHDGRAQASARRGRPGAGEHRRGAGRRPIPPGPQGRPRPDLGRAAGRR